MDLRAFSALLVVDMHPLAQAVMSNPKSSSGSSFIAPAPAPETSVVTNMPPDGGHDARSIRDKMHKLSMGGCMISASRIGLSCTPCIE